MISVLGLSFVDLYEFWTLGGILCFGIVALFVAPNDLESIVKYIAYATAVAPFVGACLAVPMWIVIKVAG